MDSAFSLMAGSSDKEGITLDNTDKVDLRGTEETTLDSELEASNQDVVFGGNEASRGALVESCLAERNKSLRRERQTLMVSVAALNWAVESRMRSKHSKPLTSRP